MSPAIDVDKYIDEIKRERARKAAGADEMVAGTDEMGANKQTNNGRSPNRSPPALLPLSRLVLSFCPTHLRHGLMISQTVFSARRITPPSRP